MGLVRFVQEILFPEEEEGGEGKPRLFAVDQQDAVKLRIQFFTLVGSGEEAQEVRLRATNAEELREFSQIISIAGSVRTQYTKEILLFIPKKSEWTVVEIHNLLTAPQYRPPRAKALGGLGADAI